MQDLIKKGLIQRTSPLTLVLKGANVKTAVKIMKTLEKENDVN